MGFNQDGPRGGFRGGSSRGGGFRRGGFRGGFNDGPREMHKIKCSDCGKDAEVPFKPREGTPVYCRDCFMKKKGLSPRAEMPAKKFTEKSEEDSDAEVEEEDTVEAEE